MTTGRNVMWGLAAFGLVAACGGGGETSKGSIKLRALPAERRIRPSGPSTTSRCADWKNKPELEVSETRRPRRAPAQRAPRLQDVRRGRRAPQDARVPRDRHEPRRHQGRRPHFNPKARRCTKRPTGTSTAASISGSTSSTAACPKRTWTRTATASPTSGSSTSTASCSASGATANFDGKADIWEIYARGRLERVVSTRSTTATSTAGS